jgi:hypothetical protein
MTRLTCTHNHLLSSLAMQDRYPKENLTSHSIEYAGGQQKSAAKYHPYLTLTNYPFSRDLA